MIKKIKKGKKGDKLTMAQSLFCYFFTGIHFNNAARAYAAAYKMDLTDYDNISILDPKKDETRILAVKKRYAVAAAGGLENLEKPLIHARIKEMLLKRFGNFEEVDAKLAEHIFGNDGTVSIAAIREFNKLKARIVEKHEIFGNFSLTELLKEADKEKK